MIIANVREILTCGINEPCPALNVIAFHRGDIVPTWLLARTIDAAHRGHITSHGKRLHLIPPKVYEQANQNSIARIKAKPRKKNDKAPNLTPWPEVQKHDCIPLPNLLPKNTDQLKARLSQYHVSNPHKHMASADANRNACRVPKGASKSDINRNAKCLSCRTSLAGKRRGSKYCDTKCKQKAYRFRSRG